ncbi:hypothetical protein PIB30_034792 [Stylosanthes scabra]|uniref:Aminotransferase-like plant mobile domain-containing protein n=1 Tax=Stylosanthes scabra TaxID=79078 RepID=A0ABU6SD48_9FABA|nr:hypothetical protein [Stylosanthes scabra]
MAPRGCSRTPRGRRSGARQGDQPVAAPQANPQDPEGLYMLNDEWHIVGALRERVLLPRRCAFLMPAPDVLLPFLEEVGFGHAIQLRDFVFDAPLLSAFVERWRLETHTFHMLWVSAPSSYRMLRTTWVSYRWGSRRRLPAGFWYPS